MCLVYIIIYICYICFPYGSTIDERMHCSGGFQYALQYFIANMWSIWGLYGLLDICYVYAQHVGKIWENMYIFQPPILDIADWSGCHMESIWVFGIYHSTYMDSIWQPDRSGMSNISGWNIYMFPISCPHAEHIHNICLFINARRIWIKCLRPSVTDPSTATHRSRPTNDSPTDQPTYRTTHRTTKRPTDLPTHRKIGR